MVLVPEIEAFQRVFTLFFGEASVGAHLRKSDNPRMVFVNEIEIWPDRGGTWKGSAPGCPALFFCLFGAIASSSSHIISSFLCGCEWQGSATKRSSGRERVYSFLYSFAWKSTISIFHKRKRIRSLDPTLEPTRSTVGHCTRRSHNASPWSSSDSCGPQHRPRERGARPHPAKQMVEERSKPSVTTPDHRALARGQSALRSLLIRVSSLLQWMALNPT